MGERVLGDDPRARRHGALHARARARYRARLAGEHTRRREDPHARRIRPPRRRLAPGRAPTARPFDIVYAGARCRTGAVASVRRSFGSLRVSRTRSPIRPALRHRLARRCPHLRPELDRVHELGPGNAGVRERRDDHGLRRQRRASNPRVPKVIRTRLPRRPSRRPPVRGQRDDERGVAPGLRSGRAPNRARAVPRRVRRCRRPGRHYITLAKDFSNFDAVVERLRDMDALERMTATRTRTSSLRALLDPELRGALRPSARRARRAATPRTGKLRYRAARLERPALLSAQRAVAYVNAVLVGQGSRKHL